MLKLLISDDEPLEMQFLKRAVRWEEYGIELAGTASDGLSALKLEEQIHPDIIITDIVMPGLTGIELAARVRERHPDVRFIFVSGHKSFEFAQSGLENGVDRYLLKPVTQLKLAEAVEAVSKLCLAEKRKKYEQERFYSALNENLPKMRQIFFEEIISDVPSEQYAAEQLEFYGIDLKPEHICAVLLRLDRQDKDIGVRERKLLCFEITDSINETIRPLPNICAWAHNDSEFVLLLNCTQSAAWVGMLTQSLLHNIKLSCDVTMTAGVSEVLDGYTSIPVCYKAACTAADHSFFVGSGQTIFYSDVAARSQAAIPIPTSLHEQIAQAAATGNVDHLHSSFEELHKLLTSGQPSRIWISNVCVGIISSAVSYSMQLDNGSLRNGEPPYDKLFSLGSLDEILKCTEEYLSGMCSIAATGIHGRHIDIVSQIKELVAGRLDRDISVESLAGELYLSRGYISHVFKNVTGESINRYIIKERIKRAKQLLCDQSMKITEVAAACGYENPTYFSSIFRNETGISPKEYRARKHAQERNAEV